MSQHKTSLPWLGKFILWLSLDYEDYYQAAGDYEESFIYKIRTKNPAKARLWFWLALFKSLPVFISNSIYWRGVMIKSYLKTAFRIIRKQKLFSFINVAGLAVSLSCCLLILFHVKNELSYDKSYPKADRIYRAQINSQYGSTTRNWAASAPALGPLLEESFPEVESASRISDFGTQILSYTPDRGAPRRFEEAGGVFADSSFFSLFDIEFITGSPQSALDEPNTVVLTSTLVKKYFGNLDPLGKTIMNESQNAPLQVTGVIPDFPKNTHLKIDYLISMPTFAIYMNFPEMFNHRTWKAMHTYVLLQSNQDLESFNTKAPDFMKNFLSSRPGTVEELQLQPITQIHLHSKLEGELGPNSILVSPCCSPSSQQDWLCCC